MYLAGTAAFQAVSKRIVYRLRWFDSGTEVELQPVNWRPPAVIIATLFLNFPFWHLHGSDIRMYYPLPVFAVILALGVFLITALFFIGPALAVQATRRPLLSLAENSLGAIPALGLRLCCAVFLVIWIRSLVGVLDGWIPIVFRREVSSKQSFVVIFAILTLFFSQVWRVYAQMQGWRGSPISSVSPFFLQQCCESTPVGPPL
jgi:hypothetical protein